MTFYSPYLQEKETYFFSQQPLEKAEIFFHGDKKMLAVG